MTGTAARLLPRRITLPALALLAPWVAVVIGSLKPIRDNSYLWHVAAGHLQLDTGRVLTEDPFSFTMSGTTWLTQSWLAELAYGWAHGLFGIGFTGPMLMALSGLTFAAIGLVAYRWSASVLATAIVLVLTTMLMVPFLVPRPVILSFPLMALVILAWDSPRLRWALPFLMWLWASVHGSFAIGLAYLGLRWLAARDWKAWPYLMAAGGVTLLTAHGLGVVRILGDFVVARPHLSLVTEWATPDFLSPTLAPFLVGILLLIYGSMKGRLRTSSLIVIAPFLALGMSATRAVPPAWIALVPLLAVGLGGLEWRVGRGFPRPVAMLTGAVLVGFPFLFAGPVEIAETRFPVEALGHLVQVRTFHDDSAGGYLIYTGHLDEGVFIDDRVELFLDRIDEFAAVRAGREPWEPVFVRDGIKQALLKSGEPMIGWLADVGWQEIHRDDSYVVLRPSS